MLLDAGASVAMKVALNMTRVPTDTWVAVICPQPQLKLRQLRLPQLTAQQLAAQQLNAQPLNAQQLNAQLLNALRKPSQTTLQQPQLQTREHGRKLKA